MLRANFIGDVSVECKAACDTNGDGDTGGVVDALAILTKNFIGGVEIAAPFPHGGPGSLPSDEILGCEQPASCSK